MRSVSVADAKAHFSEILTVVEKGQEMQISRRGRAIARLIPEPKHVARALFDFDALAVFVDAQVATAENSVITMRSQDSY